MFKSVPDWYLVSFLSHIWILYNSSDQRMLDNELRSEIEQAWTNLDRKKRDLLVPPEEGDIISV